MGYTVGRGLSYGAEVSTGAFILGPRIGWVSRPGGYASATEDSDAVTKGNESVSYYGLDLGVLGLGALSVGASHSDQTDWHLLRRGCTPGGHLQFNNGDGGCE